MTAGVKRRVCREDLTGREMDVLRCLAKGMSTEEMAEKLDLSLHTIRNHVRFAIAKLDCHSKVEAVARALKLGLVQPPRPRAKPKIGSRVQKMRIRRKQRGSR